MFDGFTHEQIKNHATTINLVRGGSGTPILLLHGYPQTHVCWHLIAPLLAERFTVVCPDLRGCGDSSKPSGDAVHLTYSKRTMAQDQVAVMQSLGFDEFHPVSSFFDPNRFAQKVEDTGRFEFFSAVLCALCVEIALLTRRLQRYAEGRRENFFNSHLHSESFRLFVQSRSESFANASGNQSHNQDDHDRSVITDVGSCARANADDARENANQGSSNAKA